MQNLEMQKTSNCSHWYFYKKNRQTFCVSFSSFFVTVFSFTFLSFFFWGIVLLYSSGWPGIHYGQAGLELMAIPLPLQCRDNRLELGVRLQGTALAYSLLKIWVSFPALFFLFQQTNKQTNITDPDWQLTSGILTHQLRICKGYESILWVWQTDEKNPPGSLTPTGTDRTSQLSSRNQRDIPEGCQKPT